MEKSPHLWVQKCQPEACDSRVTVVENSSQGFLFDIPQVNHFEIPAAIDFETQHALGYRLSIWGQVKNNNDKNKQTKNVSRLSLLHFWPVLTFHMLQKPKNEISQNHLFLFPVRKHSQVDSQTAINSLGILLSFLLFDTRKPIGVTLF